MQKKLEEEKEIKNVIKQENNMEIIVTDAPDIDYDKLNEDLAREMMAKFDSAPGDQGGVITKDVISAASAYKYFRDLETNRYLLESLDLTSAD